MKQVNLNEIRWRERKSPKVKYHRFLRDVALAFQRPCLLYSVLAGLVLAGLGCKSSSGGDGIPLTASGLPEITVRANDEAAIKRSAVEFFLNRGYVAAHAQYSNEVAFDKPTQKSERALRVRLRIHKQADNTWLLVGTPMGVDGWHTNLETETVLLEGASQIQGFLVEIKARVESPR